MALSGTNNGGGPRWAKMPRAVCPRCGLNKPVGVTQSTRGFVCNNRVRCDARAKKKAEAK